MEGYVLFLYPGDFSWREIGVCLLSWFAIENGHVLPSLGVRAELMSRVRNQLRQINPEEYPLKCAELPPLPPQVASRKTTEVMRYTTSSIVRPLGDVPLEAM